MEIIEGNLSKLVKIVCPSSDELSVIVNNVKCTQCDSIFNNEPRRRLHELKVHQRKNLDRTVKESIRYHCPEKTCIYSPDSTRYFKTMKYLKQHYLKVHAAKTYSCTKCDKSFSTESAQIAHIRVCGLEFTCSCLKNFNTYEALLTHAKRHLHTVNNKYKNLLRRNTRKSQQSTQILKGTPEKKLPISILPFEQNVNILGNEVEDRKSTRDIAIQTDDLKKFKKIVNLSKNNRRRESRQTQTHSLSKGKISRNTTATQTHFLHKGINKKNTDIKEEKYEVAKKDFEINYEYSNDNMFSNSPLQLNSDVLSNVNDIWEERNSSGTQTVSEKNFLDVFNDSVTQTEFISFLYPNSGISRSDPMLTEKTFNDRYSSIETQTEKEYLESIFDLDYTCSNQSRTFALSSNIHTQTTQHFNNIEHLLYSNMCTQTCNDILNSDLVLSDTQTQTAWSELTEENLNSEKSQHQNSDEKTDMSMIGCKSWLNIQTNHMETQTDLLNIFDELQ
ncbi:protein indeterminate-domain 5, chloroplastic [Chelonus insularis]|uniref:protein indeterminate-domain 5, chloroplastic n=1 Tax=Chelonus insularis TaxID=460826 RepID=UPI00158D9B3C|nr:protein indeterminate-domain 5, chloroplastic [Chelonus insularis]XP_034946891.1 protein indeterminate-domain 5, chloroplastic [Chelonus insularis]